jgi:hypothetical protein
MSDQHSFTVPGWLAKVVCATCGLVVLFLFASVPWANNISSNIAEIKTQQAASHQLASFEMQYLRERVANGEQHAKELEARVRDLENALGTRRTASRPPLVD